MLDTVASAFSTQSRWILAPSSSDDQILSPFLLGPIFIPSALLVLALLIIGTFWRTSIIALSGPSNALRNVWWMTRSRKSTDEMLHHLQSEHGQTFKYSAMFGAPHLVSTDPAAIAHIIGSPMYHKSGRLAALLRSELVVGLFTHEGE